MLGAKLGSRSPHITGCLDLLHFPHAVLVHHLHHKVWWSHHQALLDLCNASLYTDSSTVMQQHQGLVLLEQLPLLHPFFTCLYLPSYTGYVAALRGQQLGGSGQPRYAHHASIPLPPTRLDPERQQGHCCSLADVAQRLTHPVHTPSPQYNRVCKAHAINIRVPHCCRAILSCRSVSSTSHMLTSTPRPPTLVPPPPQTPQPSSSRMKPVPGTKRSRTSIIAMASASVRFGCHRRSNSDNAK